MLSFKVVNSTLYFRHAVEKYLECFEPFFNAESEESGFLAINMSVLTSIIDKDNEQLLKYKAKQHSEDIFGAVFPDNAWNIYSILSYGWFYASEHLLTRRKDHRKKLEKVVEYIQVIADSHSVLSEILKHLANIVTKDGYIVNNPEVSSLIGTVCNFLRDENYAILIQSENLDKKYSVNDNHCHVKNHYVNTTEVLKKCELWDPDSSSIWTSTIQIFMDYCEITFLNVVEFCHRLLIASRCISFVNTESTDWLESTISKRQLSKTEIEKTWKNYKEKFEEAITLIKENTNIESINHRFSRESRLYEVIKLLKSHMKELESAVECIEKSKLNQSQTIDNDVETNCNVVSYEELDYVISNVKREMDRFLITVRITELPNIDNKLSTISMQDELNDLINQNQEDSDSTLQSYENTDYEYNVTKDDEDGLTFSCDNEITENEDEYYETLGRQETPSNLNTNSDFDKYYKLSCDLVIGELKGSLSARKDIMKARERAAYKKIHGEDPSSSDDEMCPKLTQDTKVLNGNDNNVINVSSSKGEVVKLNDMTYLISENTGSSDDFENEDSDEDLSNYNPPRGMFMQNELLAAIRRAQPDPESEEHFVSTASDNS